MGVDVGGSMLLQPVLVVIGVGGEGGNVVRVWGLMVACGDGMVVGLGVDLWVLFCWTCGLHSAKASRTTPTPTPTCWVLACTECDPVRDGDCVDPSCWRGGCVDYCFWCGLRRP